METKMTSGSDAGTLRRELLASFEAFKLANDERLTEIEKKGAADPLIEDRVDRIDATLNATKTALDKLAIRLSRGGQALPEPDDRPEHKSAWSQYMRTGDDSALSRLDTKALTVGTENQGGYVAPPELDRLIEARLMAASPMRQISTVRQTSSPNFKKPVSLGSPASWVAETGVRSETTATTLSLLEIPAAELYAMPAATQALLDDTYADIDAWLADEVETAFAAQESEAFVSGDGTNKPKGFLDYTKTAEASHQWGEIGYTPSGADGAFETDKGVERLLDLIYTPASQYRASGRFVMNRRTVSACRKLKDGDGRYIFAPGSAGEASSLLGYPVTEIEDMPDIGSDTFAIAFGDFRKGYLIFDRQGARVLRDPYSAKPYVLFYTTKRVGGGVQNFDAIKLMKFSVN